MGAGKSTVGRKIAQSLSCPFLDTDTFIEKQTKMSIAEIFEVKGEVKFRELERELAFSFKPNERIVVATGGGFACNDGIMEVLNAVGTTIYLKVAPHELAERIYLDSTSRPLLKKAKNLKELQNHINQLLIERAEYYNQAQFVVDGGQEVVNVVSQINLLLNQR
jgi:shikimate kinase